jgi:hypothetical protein
MRLLYLFYCVNGFHACMDNYRIWLRVSEKDNLGIVLPFRSHVVFMTRPMPLQNHALIFLLSSRALRIIAVGGTAFGGAAAIFILSLQDCPFSIYKWRAE